MRCKDRYIFLGEILDIEVAAGSAWKCEAGYAHSGMARSAALYRAHYARRCSGLYRAYLSNSGTDPGCSPRRRDAFDTPR